MKLYNYAEDNNFAGLSNLRSAKSSTARDDKMVSQDELERIVFGSENEEYASAYVDFYSELVEESSTLSV